MGISAYRKTIRESEAPRQLERRILARLTGDLERFEADFDDSETDEDRIAILAAGLREALIENLRFWTIIKHDLASEGNALPVQLRGNLISLAIFVDRQTGAALGGRGTLGAIIDVNRSILAGLAGVKAEPVEA